MRGRLFAGLMLAVSALSGCVGTLDTLPNRQFTAADGALRGISYALPKARYAVTLTRTLAECPVGLVDNNPTALKFSVSAVATPTMVAGESYTIDYEKLPGWLRTANFEIKHYPNGTLKSLGAGAEDKTGEVINSVAKTAFSLASVFGLSSGDAPLTATPPAQIVRCTVEAEKAVTAARTVERDLKQITARLSGYEKEGERLRAAGAARLIDAAGRQRFLTLLDDINLAEAEIERLKREQGDLAKKLGVVDEIDWNGGVTAPDYNRPYPLSPAQRAKLTKLLLVAAPDADYPTDEAEAKRQSLMTACYNAAADIDNCLNQQLALRSGLYLEEDLPECGADGAHALECRSQVADTDTAYRAARDSEPDGGIFVRGPQVGRVLFCRETLLAKVAAPAAGGATGVAHGIGSGSGAQPGAGGGGGSAGTQGGTLEGGGAPAPAEAAQVAKPAVLECTVAQDEAKIAAADLPQFGQLRFLPLKIGTFQAREMTVALSETGRIESFTYKSTKAPAQGLAASAADVAGQLDIFLEKRETEGRDDRKARRDEEIALLQQEITRLTKEIELKKLRTPPDVDPLQATRDETAALEVALALAKVKLASLKTEDELAAYT